VHGAARIEEDDGRVIRAPPGHDDVVEEVPHLGAANQLAHLRGVRQPLAGVDPQQERHHRRIEDLALTLAHPLSLDGEQRRLQAAHDHEVEQQDDQQDAPGERHGGRYPRRLSDCIIFSSGVNRANTMKPTNTAMITSRMGSMTLKVDSTVRSTSRS
jgi:hypothetical protein